MVKDELLLAQLVEILDDELECIESLSYRFAVLAALVGADQSPWIPRAVKDLQTASEELRLVDLRRAAATSGVTLKYGLDPDSRLDVIARHVDEGWGAILDERRSSMIEQMADLQSVADLATSAVQQRSALAEEALEFLRSDSSSTYGRRSAPLAQIVKGAL